MGDTTDALDDHISRAIVDGTPYERLRARRYSLFSGTISSKLRRQGLVLATLVATVPALAAATATAKGGTTWAALFASPKLAILGLFAVGVETLAATALFAIAALRLRQEVVDERTAHRLLNVEDMAAMLGLGTGGLAVALVGLYAVVGVLAPDALVGLQPAQAGGPFSASGTGVPLAVIAAIASVLAVVTVVGGALLRERLS
ncbi:hypothetical protein [Haloarchaeobius baliensis]|uniref:hypothetical protein n=1 Tax=Haloarchaeobius baliensis TaxID=1670458 RepID=UPI003F882C31